VRGPFKNALRFAGTVNKMLYFPVAFSASHRLHSGRLSVPYRRKFFWMSFPCRHAVLT
jgi:hypothetical protein